MQFHLHNNKFVLTKVETKIKLDKVSKNKNTINSFLLHMQGSNNRAASQASVYISNYFKCSLKSLTKAPS